MLSILAASSVTGNNYSVAGSIVNAVSDEGRYVVFESAASNLVSGDTNGMQDIFLRDTQSGTLTLVSRVLSSAANNPSWYPTINADGSIVAFTSGATNLVSGDLNGLPDVYVRNLLTQTTTLVSTNGTKSAAGVSSAPSISANGRYIAFSSTAWDLVPCCIDANAGTDIYVRDMQLGTTTSVSQGLDGPGNGPSVTPFISADGRFVVFESLANNLVPGDTNGQWDVFVRNLDLGTTSLVSVALTGLSDGYSHTASVSANGRYVSFVSNASNIVEGDTNGAFDVFVRDMLLHTTTLVSTGANGPSNGTSDSAAISGDGRFIAFQSTATNLSLADSNSSEDIYVRDLQLGMTRLVSSALSGTAAGFSYHPSITENGQFISFYSSSSTLVAGDTNSTEDVFVANDDRPDTIAPTVLATSFDATSTIAWETRSLSVTFSESVFNAQNTANFSLVGFGVDAVINTPDDVVIPLTAATYWEHVAQLTFPPLAPGVYQFTVKTTIRDYYGNRLLGRQGSLDDFVAAFTVVTPFGDIGWLDRQFGTNGIRTSPIPNYLYQDMKVDSDGKLVTGGYLSAGAFNNVALMRFNNDGSVDTTFGVGGTATIALSNRDDEITALTIQPDGKIVAVGHADDANRKYDVAIVRYNSNGTLDPTFGNGGIVITQVSGTNEGASKVIVQPDGRILVAGNWSSSSSNVNFLVRRYNSDGSPDATFGTDGAVITSVGTSYEQLSAMILQNDGRIVVGGPTWTGSKYAFAFVRYDANGSRDSSFGTDGISIFSLSAGEDVVSTMAYQSDGKVVVAGTSKIGNTYDTVFFRLTQHGQLDLTFGNNGTTYLDIGESDNGVSDALIQSDGKLLAIANITTGSKDYVAVAQLLSDGSFDPSFGTNGRITTVFDGGPLFARKVAVGPGNQIIVNGTVRIGNTPMSATMHYALQREVAYIASAHMAYSNSRFDGFQQTPMASHYLSIDNDKAPLQNGEVATNTNYSNYSRGINKIFVDIQNAPAGTTLTADDFIFRIGNGNEFSTWLPAPSPSAIDVQRDAGIGRASRVSLAWPDYAIRNTWLEVTVRATPATGLEQPAVFYFGNAVGETGNDATNAVVNATDEVAVRNHPRTFLDVPLIDSPYDFNRDGFVNATDQILARNNSTTSATALKLISVPDNVRASTASVSRVVTSDFIISVGVAISLSGTTNLPVAAPSAVKGPSSLLAASTGLEYDNVDPLLIPRPFAVRQIELLGRRLVPDDCLYDLIADELVACNQ